VETNDLAGIGYVLQMLAFATLSILFLWRRHGSPFSAYLGVASAASSLQGGVLALDALGVITSDTALVLAELARGILWILALFVVLRALDKQRLAEEYSRRYIMPLLIVALAALAAYSSTKFESLTMSLLVSGGVLMGVILISLLEQIYRNLPSDSTSSLKYICVAFFAVAAYDIVVFLRAIAGGGIEADLWTARGFVNALVVVPLAVSGWRSDFEPVADVRRQVPFYMFSLVTASVGIVLWLMAGTFVDSYGGSWGNVGTIVTGVAGLCALGVLMVSATIRARARVFLTKVFFKYKYDYRKEWLRLIATLSESGLDNVPATAVHAVCQIVNSPGGIVWIKEQEGDAYVPLGSWRCDIPTMSPISSDSALVRFLIDRQWVIDLDEKQRYPARYGGLELDASFHEGDQWWLIVPLYLDKRLFGFVWLKKPRLVRSLNFEDHDLLRTVGRHVGMHINQAESDKRLAESGQFGTYNRLTAFLMHDLNNLIAQQSLVVSNAERFRDNPKFVDDAIDTIANSVSRMKRLMVQLTRGFKTPKTRSTNLQEALTSAVQRSSALNPEATLLDLDHSIQVMADSERLTTVFEHLIRNAQDATVDNGQIEIAVSVANELVLVSISDTGEGMSAEFIRERLFRPFDSTKGSHAMGIGAYQVREYARMLGGRLEVSSITGKGTTFVLTLPVAK
jgi:putative PEP-CTERM system histidine kinase